MDEHLILYLTVYSDYMLALRYIFVFPVAFLEPIFIHDELIARVEPYAMVYL